MRPELAGRGRVQRAMNPFILTSRWLSAGAALTLASVVGAQTTNPPPQPTTPGYQETGPGVTQKEDMVSRRDRVFLEKAAKSGLKEVAVSQAVTSNLTTPAARDFAAMMVKDHTAVNNELKQLAARKAVILPPEDKADKFAEKWSEKSKNTDKDYLKEMISDHKDAVELLEKGSKSADPDIAAFAQKNLPAFQKHLDMAKAQEAALP
jgi:putative membrane protein